jgi:hypothetical protein
MILDHLSYSWFIYLLTAIIIVMFWYQAFNLYHQVKLDEKVTIYIAAKEVEPNNLESKLESKLLHEKLKDIVVLSDDYEEQDFYLKLNTKGLVKTDLLILPRSVIENINAVYLFIPLNSEYLTDYIQVDEYYYLELSGIKIAIKLNNLLDEFINDDNNDYYILINKNSVNAGSLNSSKTDLALKVLKELLDSVKD